MLLLQKQYGFVQQEGRFYVRQVYNNILFLAKRV